MSELPDETPNSRQIKKQFKQVTFTDAGVAVFGGTLGGAAGEIVNGIITVPSSASETQLPSEPNQLLVFGGPALLGAVVTAVLSNRIRYRRARRVIRELDSIPVLSKKPDQPD